MDQVVIKTNVLQVKNKYNFKSEDYKIISKNLAISFKGYPLFEYFSNNKYSIRKMTHFWNVNLKTISKKTIVIGDSKEMKSFLLFSPFENEKFSIWQYVKAGGLFMGLKMGIKSVKKMTNFEKIALEIKNKYATEECWYLYTFVTLPEYRGKGIGKNVISKMIDFLDENKQDCYLETLVEKNVSLYQKFGFELKETVSVPNSDLKIYAMLRKHK